jgi:hypothetical protein
VAIAHVEPSADPSAYGLLDYAVIFVTRSDGVVDAERAGGERFGTARVIELITRHSPELAHGADGRAPAGGGRLHGRGAGRRRPHRPRGQAVLSAYLPPNKDWIFFSASRFFCRPLTCCSISVMEEPS